MKTTSFILALIISISIGKAQTNHQVSYFSLQDVKLLSSPFLQAQQTDLHYILARPDRLSPSFPSRSRTDTQSPKLYQLGEYRTGRSHRRTLPFRTFHDVCRHRRYGDIPPPQLYAQRTTPCTASCRHRIYRRNTR